MGVIFVNQFVMILTNSVRVFLLYYFYGSLFPARKPGRWCRYVVLVITATLVYFINRQQIPLLNLGAIPIIYSLAILLIFDVSFSNAISYTFIIYVSYAGVEIIFTMILKTIAMSIGITFEQIYQSLHWILLIAIEAIRAIYVVVIRYYTNKLTAKGKECFSWQLLIVPLALFIILNTYMYMDFPDNFFVQLMICVGTILIYLVNAMIFIILVRYSDAIIREQKQELALTKSSAEQQSYEHLQQMTEQYKQYIHDMNGYLGTMRSLVEQSKSQDLMSIFHQIGAREEELRDQNYSSNYILDAMIRERVRRSKEKHILFTIDIKQGVYVDFIDTLDMISMFGNLLDNALEAAGKCDRGWVHMKLFMGNDHFMVLEVKNNFNHVIRRQGNKYLTTKENESSHGYGLENVRELVEKYGGLLETEAQSKVFVATLMLSVGN